MSLRLATIALAILAGFGGGARAQSAGRDPSLDLFFDPSRPAVRQLYLPGTRVLKHLDTDGIFNRIAVYQKKSGGRLYDPAELKAPLAASLDAGLLRAVREGKYAAALVSAGDNPRLEILRGIYPTLDPERGQWARAAMQAATDFVAGRDRHAVLRASYAYSLNPVAPGLAGFLKAVESETMRPGTRIPSGTGLSLLEVKLNATKDLFKAKRYKPLLRVCRDVLVLNPGDPTALARFGSALYMLKRYKDAAAVWTLALEEEQRVGEKKSLAAMIARAKTAGKPKPKPKPRRPKKPKPKPVDPQLIERLRRDGFSAHAAGRLEEAEAAFEKILRLVPGDKKAAKSLRRIRSEKRR
jgi:tetratricopeptide (TPR) repeat protein